jgi:MerR family transcriptional regulator/heat shock protein HspR
MTERQYTRIVIQSTQPVKHYSEEETARYSNMDVDAIRRLHTAGLVEGFEVIGGERRYSEEEVGLLRRIRRLRRDLGVNLAGVEVILRLSARLETLQRELEQYKRRQ